MVGVLNLPNVCQEELLGMSCKADRGLDSPDSGLPPSPSPSAWLLPADKARGVSPLPEDDGRASVVSVFSSGSSLRPLSYTEGISVDPIPEEVRYTSSVRYDSERHFIQTVALEPRGRALERCAQTVTALSHGTWRRYKTQLDFTPRQRPQSFRSTAIVYPKQASAAYATELSYDRRRRARRFLSSVELECGRKLPE
ncbi:refilin-B [Nerophis lumbriciformis]|uniref:refilin-B n=1 Tax=Nerophis lumbriciformis TaxID=546530 RepID=UPI002ADF1909|nr:refilin-B-like [Nerophis lumbriciformis]